MQQLNSFVLFCILSSTALAQPTCPPVEERDAEVLVFGAGVTGITVARALYQNGLTNVLVLEATDRIGGRMKNVDFAGVQVEVGANWIQRVSPAVEDSNPIWTIAHSTDICPNTFSSSNPLENFASDFDSLEAYDENGNMNNDAYTAASDEVYEALGVVEESSSELQSSGGDDITVRESLENAEWTPSTPTEHVAEWFNFDFCFAESPDVSSVFGTYPAETVYEFGDSDYFVTDQRGFSTVVDCIAEGFPENNIRLGHTVNSISHSDECVCASVTSDGNERTMCGTYGVATFSVGVLQDFIDSSLFDPPLSDSKLSFINDIRMAYYLKIFVSFPETFWNTEVEYIVHADETRGVFPVIQPLNVLEGNPNAILVTVTEDEAVRISNQDVNTTTMEIMEFLRGIYGESIPEPDDILVPTWINDPLYRGMYSNTAFGLSVEDHITFSEPEGNLYFSGEAVLEGANGFVHSGYCSGIETSDLILQATDRSTDQDNLPDCPASEMPAGAPRAAVPALIFIALAVLAAIVF